MRQHFWFILFGIAYIFYLLREKQFTFIYYTLWTFTLELIYFGARSMQLVRIADFLWPYIVAPAIVVCVGFWVIVAPMQFQHQAPENILVIVITHGFNAVAVFSEKRNIFSKDIWKPILYTGVYNLFLAIYVGGGGRSRSGQLPYWYAQYDQPIGWIFAGLSITASGVVHFLLAVPQPQKVPRQYIV